MNKKPTKAIPRHPGIYLFKNAHGDVLYIGKAKELHKRINSYFTNTRNDWKINALIEEYDDIEYILTKNELEALLLEAQLIKQYQPKYNVLLKSGQPFFYIMMTTEKPIQLLLVRNKQKKGKYIGPFLHKSAARRVYQFLMEQFNLYQCNKKIKHGCLQYHIGKCAGNCTEQFDQQLYEQRVELAYLALTQNQDDFIAKTQDLMRTYSQEFAFEKARNIKSYLDNINVIFDTINTGFHESKYLTDATYATTHRSYVPNMPKNIAEILQQFLHHDKPIITIDCFDISHFQSNALVGSCIRFTHGMPDKNNFRRFTIKTLTRQNDYAALQEIVQRRYKNPKDIPDLILIDGGKGQLHAVQQILPHAYCVSLAKKEERLFTPQHPDGIVLDIHSDVGILFMALRDYAHHFAITYHRLKRRKGVYK